VSTRCVAAYILLHRTDYDPMNRAPFRTVVDFIFVPEPERRRGVAHDLLMSSRARDLDLVAFTVNDAADSLFRKSGFELEGVAMTCPVWTRDRRTVGEEHPRMLAQAEARCAAITCARPVGASAGTCPRCGAGIYCSRACRLADARAHKRTCMKT